MSVFNAGELALLLMQHPNANVMVIDPTDATDFDYLGAVRYNGDLDRFYVSTNRDVIAEVLSGIEKLG